MAEEVKRSETECDSKMEDETSPDIRVFNLNPSNTSQLLIIPDEEGPKFDQDSLYYDMTGDKYLYILNHHTYQKTPYFKNQQPNTRNGTEKDVKKLSKLFQSFGFKDIVFDDLNYEQIIKNITTVAGQDHSKTSCVCVAILTHGDKGGELHAADRPYLFSDLITIFEKQKSLVNKPKIFLIQACRGDNMDAGNSVKLDSDCDSVLSVPTHADFLTYYSTVEDYLSYRDANGSWLIQAFCDIISKHHEDLDLLHMITLTNRKVAYERVTYTPRNRAMNKKKQMPECRYTLTKLLRFQKNPF